jgi:hypothetical protein
MRQRERPRLVIEFITLSLQPLFKDLNVLNLFKEVNRWLYTSVFGLDLALGMPLVRKVRLTYQPGPDPLSVPLSV